MLARALTRLALTPLVYAVVEPYWAATLLLLLLLLHAIRRRRATEPALPEAP